MRLILLAFTFLFPAFSSGQDLILTNGQTNKKFKTGSFVRIILPSKAIEPCEACGGDYVIGKIVSYRDELLTLETFRTGQILSEEGKMIGYTDFTYTTNSENRKTTIPANEILSVTQQGKKKYKETRTGRGIGFAFTLLGLGHLASIPFAGENGDVLAVVGLSELGLGILLAASFDQKEYITSINCPSAPPTPDKIWKLE